VPIGESRVPLRLEFTVPTDVDVAEPVSPTEAEENVRLGALRRGLDIDSRWSQHRVAAVRQAAGEWHVVLWIVPATDDEEDLEDVRKGVPDLVEMIVPGAHLVSVDRTQG
jgi:hypothetical protein